VIGKAPPEITVAFKAARALNPFGQRRDDANLRLFDLRPSAVVIRKRLVPKTVDCLPVLAGLDDVPAGMPQNPRLTDCRSLTGRMRPRPLGRP
jgi:hypothetical protein